MSDAAGTPPVRELTRREFVAWLEARTEADLSLSLHAFIRACDAGELHDTPTAMGLAVLLGPPVSAAAGAAIVAPSRTHLATGPSVVAPSRAHLAAALGCVTAEPWLAAPPLRGPRDAYVLTLADETVPLACEDGDAVRLAASLYCRPAPTATAPDALRVEAYAYAAWAAETPDAYMAWHLHPPAPPAAHLHVTGHDPAAGNLAPLPLPGEPMPLERVLHWLIASRGVVPRRPDWATILGATS